MKAILRLVGLAFLCATLTAGTGQQYSGVTMMTLRNGDDGYDGIIDTFINSSAADSGRNFGLGDSLFLSGAGNVTATWHAGRSRILLGIDISAIPDSAMLTRMRVHAYQCLGASGASSDSVALHRLVKKFSEGIGGNNGMASQGSATWTTASNTQRWNNPGASSAAAGVFARQWASIDSTVGSGYSGLDTLSFQNTSIPAYDHGGEVSTVTPLKTGVGQNRKGWISLDITDHGRNTHIGAYDSEERIVWLMLTVHNNANDKQFAFCSSTYPDTPYRLFAEVEYFDPTGGGGGGGTTVTRLGIGGGIGAR